MTTQSLQLLQTEVLDRNVDHHLPALLGPGQHAEVELVVDARNQVPGHLHVELDHVGAVEDGVLEAGQGVLPDVGAVLALYRRCLDCTTRHITWV